MKIAGMMIMGGAALAATSGLAAPALGGAIGTYFMGLSGAAATSAGLASLGGGSIAAGGFGMAGGKIVIGTLFGFGGSGLAGKKMYRRTAALEEFDFEHLGGNGMHVSIAVSGWLSQKSDLPRRWACVPVVAQHGQHYVLRWESKHLLALGAAFASLTMNSGLMTAIKQCTLRASKAGAGRLNFPAAVLSALGLIDNPWHIAVDRAEKTGKHLASILMAGVGGRRPVSLVGFSLGSRVIFYALEALADIASGHLAYEGTTEPLLRYIGFDAAPSSA
jgi:hypothetical protein